MHTLVFAFDFSTLFLSIAFLLGSVGLLGMLRYAGRTRAASVLLAPLLPLSILLFVLLGFLFQLLVGTTGQRRAGDGSGGTCERGARRMRRAGGDGWPGDGDRVPIVALQGPIRGEKAGRRVSAGGTLIHGQVLCAAALWGAG